MTKLIELDNLTKEYNGQVVLKGIHLEINEKEFVTLLGPSGCGKTTTLRIMGGFEEANGGTVLFDGQDISGLPPYKRELNTVFQKYALFPHMDVLFAEKERENYIIDNRKIFNELPVNGISKAKYDLFYAFCVEYLAIILKLLINGDIKTSTFLTIKNDNLIFISRLYLNFVIRKNPCSYDLSSLKNSIKVFYSRKELFFAVFKLSLNKIKRKG